MSISRSARQDDIEQLVALADRTFRKPGQTSMGTAYAKLFSKENAENLLMVEEDGKPVTLVGLLPARLSIDGCTIPVVSMGAVCTDPAFRGRNYADTLVKQSITKCAGEGAHLLLISGTRGLYQRNDCLEVGEVKRFRVGSSLELGELKAAGFDIRPYDVSKDNPAILGLMESEKAHYKRSEEELEGLIRCAAYLSNSSSEQHVWLSFRENGSAAGYVIFGLSEKDGITSAEVIEYAGLDEAVLGLLSAIFDRFTPHQLYIPVMGDRALLADKLASAGCSFTEMTIPGTVRMLHFTGLWNSLRPYMERRLGKAKLVHLGLTETGGCCLIHYKDEQLTLGLREATALVFNGPSELPQGVLKEILSQLFPLPFPYTQNLNFI